MVTVDKAVIAKIEKRGKHFEILVDPLLAYDLKQGKLVSIQNMLAIADVFTDSKKGMKASDHEVKELFGTDDIEKIAVNIVKNGDIQLTTSFRKEKTEERKKQIASLISYNAMDPRTKKPHPIERVLTAIHQAGVHVDAFHSAESQVDKIVQAIRPIIPISMDKLKLRIKIPAKYAGKSYGFIKTYGVKSESWESDGSLSAVLEISAAVRDEIIGKLNHITQGECDIKEI